MISLLGEKMQKPNEKKIHRLSPNIFRESIQIYMEKILMERNMIRQKIALIVVLQFIFAQL